MIERFIVEVEHSRVTSHKETFQGAFRFYLFDLEVIKIKNAMQDDVSEHVDLHRRLRETRKLFFEQFMKSW